MSTTNEPINDWGRDGGSGSHADGSLGIAYGRALTGRPALNHTIRVMPAHLTMSVTCIMIEVGIVTFSGVHAAEHAFAEARDGEPGAGWLGDAAFVEVHRRGRIVVRGRSSATTSTWTVWET